MMTATHMILIQPRAEREFHSECGEAWPRASAAFRERLRAGVDVCVSENSTGRLLKITTWLLLAQHFQQAFQSVEEESAAWQAFRAPLWIFLSSCGTPRDDLSAPSVPGKPGQER